MLEGILAQRLVTRLLGAELATAASCSQRAATWSASTLRATRWTCGCADAASTSELEEQHAGEEQASAARAQTALPPPPTAPHAPRWTRCRPCDARWISWRTACLASPAAQHLLRRGRERAYSHGLVSLVRQHLEQHLWAAKRGSRINVLTCAQSHEVEVMSEDMLRTSPHVSAEALDFLASCKTGGGSAQLLAALGGLVQAPEVGLFFSSPTGTAAPTATRSAWQGLLDMVAERRRTRGAGRRGAGRALRAAATVGDDGQGSDGGGGGGAAQAAAAAAGVAGRLEPESGSESGPNRPESGSARLRLRFRFRLRLRQLHGVGLGRVEPGWARRRRRPARAQAPSRPTVPPAQASAHPHYRAGRPTWAWHCYSAWRRRRTRGSRTCAATCSSTSTCHGCPCERDSPGATTSPVTMWATHRATLVGGG